MVGVDSHVTDVTRGPRAARARPGDLATLLANWLLLRRRFQPLDELISTMERIDLPTPTRSLLGAAPASSAEARRLEAAFNRMIGRLEEERREAGRAVMRAQEQERRGSPRTSTTRSTRR